MTILQLIESLQKIPNKEATVVLVTDTTDICGNLTVSELKTIAPPNIHEQCELNFQEWHHPFNKYIVIK